MDISNKYNLFIGTARGTVAYTNLKTEEKLKFTTHEDASEVTSLEWGRTEDEIVVGYKNGTANLYDSKALKYGKKITKLEGSEAVVGIGCAENTLIIGRRDGIINLWNGKSRDYFSIELEEKGTLECMQYHKNRQNVVATGGEANDFKLWDIETKKCIFKAKSMGHDELNLPIPTSIRGITFFPESDHLCCCATKEGNVLLYDDRTQRRPVVKFFEKQASYTTIACAYRDRQCLVGTTKGYIQLLDMSTGKLIKTFTSITGSVTSIVCDPNEPFVASTSLDRHLRIHHLETKELVHKVYLKQNLTKILMKPVVKEEEEEEIEESTKEAVDDEYEEIFSTMEVILDKKASSNPKRKSDLVKNVAVKTAKKKKVSKS